MMRRTSAYYAAAVVTKSPVSPENLSLLKKKTLVRHSLATCPKAFLTEDAFYSLCQNSYKGTTNTLSDQMTMEEATQYLADLHRAKMVIHVPDQRVVHVKPLVTLNRIQERLDLPLIDPAVHDRKQLEMRIAEAAKEESKAAAAVAETRAWRRRFWGGVAVASGLQMTGLAYLTFLVFDWDTVEPASYFVTTGTGLVMYAYMLLFRREHSLGEVDGNTIPRVLDKKWKASKVDLAKWQNLLEEAAKAEARMNQTSNPFPISGVRSPITTSSSGNK